MGAQRILRIAEKRSMFFAVLLGAVIALIPFRMYAATTYTATWASVDNHVASPEWFQDAKFGLWYHWGVYSVPAYGDEWYPRWMYDAAHGDYTHHVATYGDPYTTWPYTNFMTGANDKNGNFVQFAPKLKSAGGKLDPDDWAALFDSAGAKFAGPVAEHHDGFSMWASKVNPWNAMDKGPKMDLVKVLTDAFRAKGMKIICSSHNAYNFNGYYQYVPAQTDTNLQKLYGQMSKNKEEQYWLAKLEEIVDGYQPDYIWQDFDVADISDSMRVKFLAYYYNKAIDWGKEVVASFNDGFNTNGEVQQYERGGPASILYPYWLSEDAISSSSWCYTQGIGYYSSTQMLHRLIDLVSKNGNLLLNISPMADGTIPQGQRDVMLAMGKWLKQFGESIYATRAWDVYGEGPTKMGGGSFTTPVAGTNTDFRFTRSKDSKVLYAIILGWPGNGATARITTLNSKVYDLSDLTSIALLSATAGATAIPLTYTQDTNALKVVMPSTQPYTALAYVVKLTFGTQIPQANCSIKTPFTQYEAENFSTSSGAVKAETCPEGGQNLGYIQTGDWVSYCKMDFKNGATKFSARVSTNTSTSTGKVDIRLDSATGTLVGTLTGSATGGWSNYSTLSCNVDPACKGVHAIYLILQAGYNINWFTFTQSTVSTVPYNSSDVLHKKTVSGMLFCRDLLNESALKLSPTATGIEVFSLEGKKMMQYKINGQWNTGKFNALKKQLPSGMFYMKVLERQ